MDFSLNDIIEYGKIIIEYKPLWVFTLVVASTQGFKLWLQDKVNDIKHKLASRGISALVGGVSGDLLLYDIAGGRVEGTLFGLAIATVISAAYIPIIKKLRKYPKDSWQQSLAKWMSGNGMG